MTNNIISHLKMLIANDEALNERCIELRTLITELDERVDKVENIQNGHVSEVMKGFDEVNKNFGVVKEVCIDIGHEVERVDKEMSEQRIQLRTMIAELNDRITRLEGDNRGHL